MRCAEQNARGQLQRRILQSAKRKIPVMALMQVNRCAEIRMARVTRRQARHACLVVVRRVGSRTDSQTLGYLRWSKLIR